LIIDYLDGSAPADLETDLCIVGAGAAGIAIAQTFLGTSTDVCIIAGGGLAGTHRSQELYAGSSIGDSPFDPGLSRVRVFGGSCNLWGGGCIPLSALDMAHREWVPHSGWPLSYAELEPHYARARSFCRIESHDFAEGSFLAKPVRQPLSFDDEALVNRIFARSPIRFGETYLPQLERAPNIKVLLHAHLLEFLASPAGTAVDGARIGSLGGHRGQLRAKHYVLACGAIENARLLLLSNSVAPNGIGNDRDQVGRYFMDHPAGKLGSLFTKVPDRVTRPYDRSGGKGPAPAFPELCLSDQSQRTHRLLNGRVRPVAVEGRIPHGVHAVRRLRTALRSAAPGENVRVERQIEHALKLGVEPAAVAAAAGPESIGKLALQVGRGIGDIAAAVGRKLADKPAVKSKHVDLIGYFEQAPNPDSRVTLGEARDALGQRKICVDWRFTPLDLHTCRTATVLFQTRLAAACQGEFQPEPWLLEGSDVPRLRGTAHHMGTTRMATDPRQGVVDRHCRVHGIDNLHVAGSSVFPTGGWAFPTFTIVALSLRLAEDLKGLLA
jgi:choline dehydrogenase-like flavoprotein